MEKVSVATQTPWSWLQDDQQDATRTLKPTWRGEGGREEEQEQQLTTRGKLGPESAGVGVARQGPIELGRRQEELRLPHITPSDCITVDLSRDHTVVPTLTAEEGEGGEGEEEEEEEVPAIELLSLNVCPSSAEDTSGDEEKEDEEDEEEDKGEVEPKKAVCLSKQRQPPYPDLHTEQLSWPTVLKYMRESQSKASHFLSLVRERSKEQPPSQEGGEGKVEEEEEEEVVWKEEVVKKTLCHFCSQPSPNWSLLACSSGGVETLPKPCCLYFKEYCILVSACLRQAVEEEEGHRPKRIAIGLRIEKRRLKKTAEEKAFALMQRKKKWEELQMKLKQKKQKTLQSTSFYSLTKQTKTIQFSLVSPAILDTDWMVAGGASKKSSRGGEKRRQSRGWKGRRGECSSSLSLPPPMLEQLQKLSPPPGQLEVIMYAGSGQLFSIILPDRTGQCYYSSGHLALLITSPVPGILCCLLFNNSSAGQVVGYADELGRAFLYQPDGSLSLLLTPNEGVLYSQKEAMKKKWAGLTHYNINKHLSLQCTNQDHITISLIVHQQNFTIVLSPKLKEMRDLTSSTTQHRRPDRPDTFRNHLTHTRSQISYLLAALSGRRLSQRLPELQTIAGLGSKVSTQGRGKLERQRSRSTEALRLHPLLATPTTTTKTGLS